jgi:hypothetical protein
MQSEGRQFESSIGTAEQTGLSLTVDNPEAHRGRRRNKRGWQGG